VRTLTRSPARRPCRGIDLTAVATSEWYLTAAGDVTRDRNGHSRAAAAGDAAGLDGELIDEAVNRSRSASAHPAAASAERHPDR
jgi:hypothetical protein